MLVVHLNFWDFSLVLILQYGAVVNTIKPLKFYITVCLWICAIQQNWKFFFLHLQSLLTLITQKSEKKLIAACSQWVWLD